MSYDEYYDTNVEYIGTIPATWDLVHNKHLFNKTKVIVGPNWDKYNVLSLTKQGVIIKDIENNQGKMPSDFSIYQIVNPGNLLMCLFDIDVTPRCVGYIENKGIVSAAYTELSSTTEIDMKYYYWWYLMLDIDKQLLHLSKNLRNSLSTEDFMALSVVKPPLEEQKQIANYLDKKTAKIDTTIAKNEELIELLEEKRVALINQVVTKGLNPDVAMKDSGVEWIGEIPEHWDISKVKHELTFLDHKRIPLSAEVRSDMDRIYDYYGASGIIDKVDSYLFDGKYILVGEDGANLLSRSTPLAFIAEGKFWVNNHAHILSPKYRNNIDYFVSLLEAADYTPFIEGSAQPKLTADNLKNIILIKPPLSEQNEMATFLNNELNHINQILFKIQDNIVLLEEYKTSLIHHVVTGKIDVRGEEI